MRQFILLTTFLFLVVKTYCQAPYVPIPLQNCYWQMKHTKSCTAYPPPVYSEQEYKIYPLNDTLISAIRYVKLYSQLITNSVGCITANIATTGYWGALRQDTTARKIYLVSPNQTSEKLLYDFNYTKGDSVKTYLGDYVVLAPRYRIIDSVYYQSYSDGVCRKTFKLKARTINSGFDTYIENNYIIEGIGNETGLDQQRISSDIFMGNPPDHNEWSSFLTINNNTISAVTTNTCQQYIGLKEFSIVDEAKIFPNPGHDEITLSITDSEYLKCKIIVYDILGNQVLSSNEKTFNIDHLPKGVYYLKCFSSTSQKTIVEKLIKD
jgi:hypothetical protein